MRHRSANGKEAPAPIPAKPRGYGLIGAFELMPRGGKATLTPTSMLSNKADNLIRTQGVIVRGIRDSHRF